MPNIPTVKVGNTVYDIKDVTAREHLVEVSQTRPISVDNKLWIQEEQHTYEIPTMDDLNQKIKIVSGTDSVTIGANTGEVVNLSIPNQGGYFLRMVSLGLSGLNVETEGSVFLTDLSDLKKAAVQNKDSRAHNWDVLWIALFIKS